MSDYECHQPEKTLLYEVAQENLETFLANAREQGAWDARLTSEELRAFLRALFPDQRRRARRIYSVQAGQCGAVTVIQRFGSALNTNPHFHSIVLDGVYGGPLRATRMAASVRSQIATGKEAGQPWHRLGDRVEPMEPHEDGASPTAEPPLVVSAKAG